MKKVIAVALLATLVTSCASKGWSCKKRYVKADIEVRLMETKKNCVAQP